MHAADEVLPKHVNRETLKAVRDGLDYLARTQAGDGGWHDTEADGPTRRPFRRWPAWRCWPVAIRLLAGAMPRKCSKPPSSCSVARPRAACSRARTRIPASRCTGTASRCCFWPRSTAWNRSRRCAARPKPSRRECSSPPAGKARPAAGLHPRQRRRRLGHGDASAGACARRTMPASWFPAAPSKKRSAISNAAVRRKAESAIRWAPAAAAAGHLGRRRRHAVQRRRIRRAGRQPLPGLRLARIQICTTTGARERPRLLLALVRVAGVSTCRATSIGTSISRPRAINC